MQMHSLQQVLSEKMQLQHVVTSQKIINSNQDSKSMVLRHHSKSPAI